MINKRFVRLVASLYFVLVFAPVQSASTPTALVTQVTEGNQVQMQLSSTRLQLGEPLLILLKVTNLNSPIRIGNFGLKPFYAEGNDFEVTIHRPGDLPVRYTGPHRPGVYTTQEHNLYWGESVHLEYAICYDPTQPNGYVFSKPGEYIIDVVMRYSVLRDPKQSTISQTGVKITVDPPTGKEAEAFELINNKKAALAIHQLVTGDQEVLKNAQTVAEKYPDTVYAPMCLYLLGSSENTGENANHDNAIKAFTLFLRRYPGHIRSSSAIYNIVLANYRARRHDLARDWYMYLKDHDPSYFLLRRENVVAAHYYFNSEDVLRGRRWWLYEQPWEAPPPPKQDAQQPQAMVPGLD